MTHQLLHCVPQNALPWEINKVVLDTVGESTMGGLLEDVKTLAGRYKVLPGGKRCVAPALMRLHTS